MKQPDLTTIAIFRADRKILSKIKRVKQDGRLETDFEVIHRLMSWTRKTRKQKLQDLLGGDFDPTLVEEAIQE